MRVDEEEGRVLDDLDAAIISLLGRDGRMSYTAIAERFQLSEGTVRKRVSRLMDRGLLNIVALCNPVTLGLQALRVFLTLDQPSALADACRGLADLPQTNRVAAGSGTHDVYLELTCRDLADAQQTLDAVRNIPGVATIQVSLVTQFSKDHSWQGLRGGSGQRNSDAVYG